MDTPSTRESDAAWFMRLGILFDSASGLGFGEELRGSPFAVLLDEGFTVEQIRPVIEEGIGSVAGVREVLRGAPLEWVDAWEEGGRRDDR